MTTTGPQPDPATQVKALKFVAKILAITGPLVGFGMPVLFVAMKIEVAMTPSGFDLVWLAPLALMVSDFVLAWYFWRRAERIEGSIPPA